MAGHALLRIRLAAAFAAAVISSPMQEADETSLLQVRLETSLAGNDHLESPNLTDFARVTNSIHALIADHGVARADIPEASYAWALYQKVPSGPPMPWALANDTEETPPGEPLPGWTQLYRDAVNRTVVAIDHFTEEDRETFGPCLGKGWRTLDANPFTGMTVAAVSVPQLVPFVVPMGHPNRTDISVVIVPGGGNKLLSWENEGTDVAKWLNVLGISAFVLKYRVPASMWVAGASTMDAQRAVSLVKHMAPALRLNASRVGMFGASAGGGIALFTGFLKDRSYDRRDVADDATPKPDFLLLLYPGVSGVLASFTVDLLSLYDLSHGPPIFVANGAQDECCNVESLYALHTLLMQRGDPVVELNIYSDVGHAFTMCYRGEEGGWEAMQHEACVWMLRARRFIMWKVEKRAPHDINLWYDRVVKFDTSLIATNSSGSRERD